MCCMFLIPCFKVLRNNSKQLLYCSSDVFLILFYSKQLLECNCKDLKSLPCLDLRTEDGSLRKGSFHWRICRVFRSNISKFSGIFQQRSDSPLFSTIWGISRISKFSRISRQEAFLKRTLSSPVSCAACLWVCVRVLLLLDAILLSYLSYLHMIWDMRSLSCPGWHFA